jgi:hypothetical protein
VETDSARTASGGAVAQNHRERSYPSFDCVGSYLWIWERLIEADVVARDVGCPTRTSAATSREWSQ